MDLFFDILTSFPTALWAVPFGVSLILLVFSLLTGIGTDGAEPEVDVDVDVDADVDVDVDAGDLAVDGHHGWFHGLLDDLAVGTVPFTILLTSLSGVGFLLSFAIELAVGEMTRGVVGGSLYAIVAMILTFIAALWATTWVIKPIKPLFICHTQRAGTHLVGKIVTVTSSKITATYGTAVIKAPDKSGDIVINVRTDHDHPYQRGDEVVVVDFDADKLLYTVAPMRAAIDAPLDSTGPAPGDKQS